MAMAMAIRLTIVQGTGEVLGGTANAVVMLVVMPAAGASSFSAGDGAGAGAGDGVLRSQTVFSSSLRPREGGVRPTQNSPSSSSGTTTTTRENRWRRKERKRVRMKRVWIISFDRLCSNVAISMCLTA